jgi:ribonucleoside-triphosphate reductase
MKGIQFDNASQRKSYVGWVYEAGVKAKKQAILSGLDEKYSKLHSEGKIHIHNLEAYGQTYNCLTFNILNDFPYGQLYGLSDHGKIHGIINHYKNIIAKMGNEQSGGMAFANFDEEICILFGKLDISNCEENRRFLKECIGSFINWINESRERCGQVSYYVSLNLGLSVTDIGRFVTLATLNYFMESPPGCMKPNIVFKVKKGVNYLPGDKNYDLFCLSVKCTCKKMIPTYLLCDSKPNTNLDPDKIAIMGCRTRVVQNQYGENTSIGRGNIAFITINLPRIALEIDQLYPKKSVKEKTRLFLDEWTETANMAKEILIDRYNKLLQLDFDDFPTNLKYNLWLKDFKSARSLEEIFINGTLSIGFIGLSEAVEIMAGGKYYSSQENYEVALGIVRHMRGVIDGFRRDTNLNFTLLATSGEFISGRFPGIDRTLYTNDILNKGYYTNSFHVAVDSRMHPYEKLRYEGAFHELCNGGCISYVEFESAPLTNTEAVKEVIGAAIASGVSYFGINFPLDDCLKCGNTGTFDDCPSCGSSKVLRIRRVSGYLEDLNFFTEGKKAEVAHRKPNAYSQYDD